MSLFQNNHLFEEVITPDGFRFKRRKTPKAESDFQQAKDINMINNDHDSKKGTIKNNEKQKPLIEKQANLTINNGKENLPQNLVELIKIPPSIPIPQEERDINWKKEIKPYPNPSNEREKRVINLKESLEKLERVLKMEVETVSNGTGLPKYPKVEKGEYLKHLEPLRVMNPEIRSGELFKEALKYEKTRTGGLYEKWDIFSEKGC
jgi:hypothetical protein